jgi:hypothetical protein
MPEETPKQQQETLSLRISRELRKRLEKIREITASVTGEYVSTSEVAKQILESAHNAALQDRIAVADMLQEPTKSLVTIRRKCEDQRPLTRPEWTVLAHYVMQGVEAQSSHHISRESSIAILKAFLAVHQLRKGDSQTDSYFLGYLRSPQRGAEVEDTAENVREAVAYTIKHLEDPANRESVPFIGRPLYVALDEDTSPLDRLNQALCPFWKLLWPIAARGHYFEQRRHKPVREATDRTREVWNEPEIPSIQEGDYSLRFALDGHDFDMLLKFPESRGVAFAFGGYPAICEFLRLLERFNPEALPKRAWSGDHYFAYVTDRDKPNRELWFRPNGQGATLRFSMEELSAVRKLFQRAWAMPELQSTWEMLTMEFGEL